jgi:hypothetical protein
VEGVDSVVPPAGRAVSLEHAARALVEALEAPGAQPAAAVRGRAEALHDAIEAAHPRTAGLPAAVAAEHAELGGSAGAAVAAVASWALTDAGDPERPARRRAAVAAARTLHDDLRVHHAHESAHQVAPE